MKFYLILICIFIFSMTSHGETIGASSIEWLTSASDIIAVGQLEKLGETKGEWSVVYESYLLKVTEVIKGKEKLREIKFVNRSLSDYESLETFVGKKSVLVFLIHYKEKDRETFLHDKLVPTNKSFPLSIMDLDNPTDKYIFDTKSNRLTSGSKILEICKKTNDDLEKFLKQNPAFKIESRVIESNFIAENMQFLIVPNFMFPNAKKSVFELWKRND